MTEPLHLSIGYLTLGVGDFGRAVAFYRDTLELPLQFLDEGFHYARFRVGAMSFAVVSGEEHKRQREGQPDRHAGIAFCVPDVDAAYRSMTAKGVRFTMPPSKQPWGGYMALFADPDGNVFYLDTPQPA
ncbi:MAG TPA: VOC family protein [Rhizomicrobium sp.]